MRAQPTALTVLAASLAAHARFLKVISGSQLSASSASDCAEHAYLGTYGDAPSSYAVYEASESDSSCAGADQHVGDGYELFHVQAAGVDASVTGDWSFAGALQDLLFSVVDPEGVSGPQVALHEGQQAVISLHATESSALLAIRKSSGPAPAFAALDAALERSPYLSAVALPTSALPLRKAGETSAEEEHLQAVLDDLAFSGEVASVLSSLSLKAMHSDVTWLTGEDPKSPIWSRHSYSDGALVAADWLLGQFEASGARCRQWPFLDGYAPDVICEYPVSAAGNASAPAYILGAHYDSRGSWGSTRAPGADDDGSGTTQLLAIARAIKARGVRFRAPVRLVAFAGEEQGLLGSRAYARKLRANGADVALMIQADMLAYHDPAEPPQLGLPAFIHTPVASQLVGNLSALYAPELRVGVTAACCSDHQSFVEQGYVATQVFERAGPIVDPMYHNSGDLVNRTGYDLEQVRSIAKVTFATLLHAAGYDLDE